MGGSILHERAHLHVTCLISSDHRLLENGSVGLLSGLVDELSRGRVAETRMWTDLIVVPPPALDQNSGLLATAKPLQAQALVAKFVVQTLVSHVLPRLTPINVGGVVGVSQSLQDRPGDELGSDVRTQVAKCAVDADETAEAVDHLARTDTP